MRATQMLIEDHAEYVRATNYDLNGLRLDRDSLKREIAARADDLAQAIREGVQISYVGGRFVVREADGTVLIETPEWEHVTSLLIDRHDVDHLAYVRAKADRASMSRAVA